MEWSAFTNCRLSFCGKCHCGTAVPSEVQDTTISSLPPHLCHLFVKVWFRDFRTRWNGLKLHQGRFSLGTRKTFFLALEQGAQGMVESCRCGTLGHGLAVLSLWLGSMVLQVFSNLNDSMILHLGQEGSNTHSLNTGQRRKPIPGTYKKPQNFLPWFRDFSLFYRILEKTM